MKFAILGTDAEIVQLATAARGAGHDIVWVGDVRDEDAEAIRSIVADRTDRTLEWELLLGQGVVDGVLVGRGSAPSDQRAEQLKRLAVEAVPLLVTHPIFESVLPYYEIDMARRETGAIIQHYNSLVDHHVLAELAQWVREGHPTIGTIHQVTCERETAGGSREIVLSQLARDVELLAAVAGDIRRVSAIGPATTDSSFASLQVQISAANVSSLRWSVGSTAASAATLRLTLLGERGSVTLRGLTPVHNASPQSQLETSVDERHDVQPLETFDAPRAAVDRLAAAVAESNSERRAAASTWETATRDMEVVDAVELSLQKGRTIEVFQQQLTERLAFRGTMAALGCGLMLLAFFAVVAVAVLGGAEGLLQQRLFPGWPFILLAVLAFFLLLQAVPLLAQKRRKDDGDSAR